MTINLVVYGSPAPQGSKKFLGTFAGKDGRMHAKLAESSKRVKPWRQDVKAAAESQRPASGPLDGPLNIHMVFTLPKPKSAPKGRRTWPDRKPDLDKLCRSTLDSLVSSGLIADDARVVCMTLEKVFPGEGDHSLKAPGVYIQVAQIHGGATQGVQRTIDIGLPAAGECP